MRPCRFARVGAGEGAARQAAPPVVKVASVKAVERDLEETKEQVEAARADVKEAKQKMEAATAMLEQAQREEGEAILASQDPDAVGVSQFLKRLSPERLQEELGRRGKKAERCSSLLETQIGLLKSREERLERLQSQGQAGAIGAFGLCRFHWCVMRL